MGFKRASLLFLALTLPLSGCGNLFDCYDATLVGAAGYQMTVVQKASGKRRGIHTTADIWTTGKVAKWAPGDELVVCNAIVTNTTKKESAACGDFGCLALWP
jgi:hypothetical protein